MDPRERRYIQDSYTRRVYSPVPPPSNEYFTSSSSSNESSASCLPFLRYGIFAANIVQLVVGAIMVALGVYLRTDSRFRDFLSERYRQAVGEAFWEAPTLFIYSYIMIVLGCAMIVVSFFGCCGLTGNSRCMCILYAMCLFVLIVATISSVVYVLFKKDGIDVELSDALNYMVQHYYQGAGVVQESLDHLQHAFRCCGNAGCSDFRVFRQDPPRSCDIRCDGCHYRISLALRIGYSVALVVLAGVILCQLLALCFALYLVFNSQKTIEVVREGYHYPVQKESPPRLTREAVKRLNLQSLHATYQ